MTPRSLLSLASVALLLLAPTAAAIDVSLGYEAARMPIATAVGALSGEGRLEGGLLAAGLAEARLGPTRVTWAEGDGNGSFSNRTFEGATLVVHEGSLFSQMPEGARLSGTVASPYGIFATLPGGGPQGEGEGDAPRDGPEAAFGRPIMVAGLDTRATLALSGDGADLFLFDAVVSVLDAHGRPFAGYDRRAVNEGLRPDDAGGDAGDGGGDGGSGGPQDGGPRGALLRIDAGAALDLPLRVLLSAPGERADFRMTVRPSDNPRFAETLDAMAEMGDVLGGGEGGEAGGESGAEGLRDLAPVAPALNGIVILLHAPDEAGLRPTPIAASSGGAALDVGLVTVLRGGETTLAWDDASFSVAGSPALVFSGMGFATPAPALLGPVPLVAVVLWALAAAAIVYFLVRRPPKTKAPLGSRALAALVHLVAFLGAFWWWDVGFREVFGTSFLAVAPSAATSTEWIVAGGALALQLAALGLAGLLFAFPLRIALGVLLRDRTKKKGYSGYAKATGVLVAALLGQPMLLWLLSLPLGIAANYLPA